MSFEIETRNKGAVDHFGFIPGDITEIGMGDLPRMSRQEFCEYAPQAVIASLPYATPDQLMGIRRVVQEREYFLRYQNNGNTPILDTVPAETLKRVYGVNPFWVDPTDRTISIGETYNGIDIGDFGYYTLKVIGGGIFGWKKGEIPDEAVQGFRLIKDAVSRM